MIKVAFAGIPISGGNYTHFKYLKDGLENVQMCLIALGHVSQKIYDDPSFFNLGQDLDVVKDKRQLAKLFLAYVHSEKIDIVIPMNSPVINSIIPFLPTTCQVIQIVNSDTPRVYKYVTSHLEYVNKIVCISRKQQLKLKTKIDVDFYLNNLCLIPHGVLINDREISKSYSKLRIGYLGRMHQGHKNIFLIPDILKKLKCPFHLELIGDGEDASELFRKLDDLSIEYNYVGEIDNDQIKDYLKQWDIQLFPSTVEGFGLTLLECMNVGVVPLAHEIKGITDYIVTHEKDGFLIPNNKIIKYVEFIEILNSDRDLLNKMKFNAKETVKNRFNLSRIIDLYQILFDQVVNNPKLKIISEFSEWIPFVEYKPKMIDRIIGKFKS